MHDYASPIKLSYLDYIILILVTLWWKVNNKTKDDRKEPATR